LQAKPASAGYSQRERASARFLFKLIPTMSQRTNRAFAGMFGGSAAAINGTLVVLSNTDGCTAESAKTHLQDEVVS
jgi:hypothetical protein